MKPEFELKQIGFQEIQDFTYPGTYVFVTLSNLLSEQSYNRGNKRWTKAEFVFLDTSFSGPDQKKIVLNAWTNIARFKDQFLFVPEPSGDYTVYNYAAAPLFTGGLRDALRKAKA